MIKKSQIKDDFEGKYIDDMGDEDSKSSTMIAPVEDVRGSDMTASLVGHEDKLPEKDVNYFKSKEYADLVKYNKLGEKLTKEDFSYFWSDERASTVAKAGWCKKLVLASVGTLGISLLAGVESMIPAAVAWSSGMASLVVLLAGSYWGDVFAERIEKDNKKNGKFVIKDRNNNPVSAIWFLYHNLDFKSLEDKEMFLKLNYKELNIPFHIDLGDYKSKSHVHQFFFEDILKRSNRKFKESTSSAQTENKSISL